MRYTYTHTKKITELLNRIERARIIIEELPVLPNLEENIRRNSLLKSSLFSARIEGNTLDMRQVQAGFSEKKKEQLEVANILRAIHFIRSPRSPRRITRFFIKQLHTIVMHGLSSDAGGFRHEPSAIFNSAGVAVYMTVPPMEVEARMQILIEGIKKATYPIPIIASLAHVEFEKIHPFLDGNGRVGRLLSQLILDRGGYGCKGMISFEEYLESTKQDYYDLLELSQKNMTGFVEYFLEAFLHAADAAILELKKQPEHSNELLLPRRQEILNIIVDHRQVSFDFIKRRFMAVTESTLHYDLQQLLKKGFIKKLGKTRAVVYIPS